MASRETPQYEKEVNMVNGIKSTNNLSAWLQAQQSGGQNKKQSAGDVFSALDMNGDGIISKDEFIAARTKSQTNFANQLMASQSASTSSLVEMLKGLNEMTTGLDKVNDVVVANTTAPQVDLPSTADFIAKVDKDGDGMISLAEFTAAGPKSASGKANDALTKTIFNSIDKNGDGLLSADELEADRQAKSTGSTNSTKDFLAGLSSFLTNMTNGASSTTAKSASSAATTGTASGGLTSLLVQSAAKYLQFA